MRIKQGFLLLSFVLVSLIALGYGLSPSWFARRWLGVSTLDANLSHMLRAVTGLYLGFGLFWLYAAFDARYRQAALLTVLVFTSGLCAGRIVSYFVDGPAAPLLQFYLLLEVAIVPVAWWVFRRPD
ncbi:DUF4345 domain-containing protein [Hydrocarboniphaga sp.]|uniref:DUF4345 domain-containing protein n=1 Tax=Hydrocarboniphaga sp. TaxID=2033016 RepID=UPI003D0BA67D